MGATACSSKDVSTDVPTDNNASDASGGAAGQGGSAGEGGSAGSGGEAGSGGDAGSGGVAGSGGSGGDGGSDAGDDGAGPNCLGDTTVSDAGLDCATLPLASAACSDGDGGTLAEPIAVTVCKIAQTDVRAGIFEAFYTCLSQIAATGPDACDPAPVEGCINTSFAEACATNEANAACAAIASTCPTDPDAASPFDLITCETYMGALTPASVVKVQGCYDAAQDGGATDCGQTFSDCLSNF